MQFFEKCLIYFQYMMFFIQNHYFGRLFKLDLFKLLIRDDLKRKLCSIQKIKNIYIFTI